MTVTSDSRPNPHKRNDLIRKLSRAPWWLLVLGVLILLFVQRVQDEYPYPLIWKAVKQGVEISIKVSVMAYALALALGLILALLRRSSNFVVYQLSTLFVEAVRGIPTLVLVYYMALALIPELIGVGNDLGEWLIKNPIQIPVIDIQISLRGLGEDLATYRTRDFPNLYRAVIALAVSYSAFLSEIFRAGIDSVSVGQIEAARSLGMTRWQTMRLIVLPQAIRVVLPPLGNDFIAMLKESSLVSVLGVPDITKRGQTVAASTYRIFQPYNVIAMTYLVLTLSLSIVVKLLEMYLDHGKARSSR